MQRKNLSQKAWLEDSIYLSIDGMKLKRILVIMYINFWRHQSLLLELILVHP
jgi:hypothetical protein